MDKGDRISILLVDDDEDFRHLIRDAIQDARIENPVYEVSSGKEALDFLYRRGVYADAPRPGLIYLDIMMPGLTGQEVLRELRGDVEFSDIPVVMMTSLEDDRQKEMAARNGANSFTLKPTHPIEFLKTVNQITDYWVSIHKRPEITGGAGIREKGVRTGKGKTKRRPSTIKTEGELHSFGDQLKFALGLSGIGISIIDLEGRWLSWSEFSEKNFDQREEVIGKQPSNPIQLEEAEFKKVMHSVERKGIYHGEVELSTNDGSKGWSQLTVTKLFDRKDAHVGFLCITKDRAEERESGERPSENIGEMEGFIYTLCHDLKTPLCAIEGYSSLLREDYEDKIDEEGRHYLNRITNNTARMANLIDQLKEYSNVTKATAPYEEIDLSEVVREALANINDHMEGKKVTCTINHLPTVYGERNKMIQVFNHLLESSIKFSQNENPTIEIDCEEEGRMYQVSIKQDVQGMEMEDRDEVLQMVQCLSGGPNYFAGGLGLAIVRKIVEDHGGNVWAESKQREGSAFCFTLPKGTKV